jgi:hypothetical protein
MSRLPFDTVDLLIVDEMGKEISGGGMDANVVGRKFNYNRAAEDEYPKVTRIYVRSLTEATHGNVAGLAIADFAHAQVIREMNPEVSYTNAVTASSPAAVSVPIHYDTDRQVLDVALQTIGYIEPEQAKMIWIRNTLELEHLLVSEAYAEEIQRRDDLTIRGPAQDLQFTAHGDLHPFPL